MLVGALVAPRGGGREEKSTARVVERNDRRGAAQGCGKDSWGGEKGGAESERVRIELILFHSPALLPFIAVQLLTVQLAATPFAFPTPRYLFIRRRIRGDA